jgi:hypothetical protein
MSLRQRAENRPPKLVRLQSIRQRKTALEELL